MLLGCFLSIYAQDYSKASIIPNLDGDFVVWYKQCKQKNNDACYFLGLSYMEGYNTVPNKQKGKKILLNACKNNTMQACLALQHYNPSLDLDSNIISLYEWSPAFIPYKKACELGNVNSCETIAKMLLTQANKKSDTHSSKSNNNRDILATANNHENNYLDISIELKQEYQDLHIKIVKVLDNFCDSQAESFLSNSTCKVLEDFKLTFHNITTNKMPALISLCQKSLQNPNSPRIDCARAALKYKNGDDVLKDKQKAYEYFSLACEKHKEFCYNKVLDSILSED